MAFVAVPRRFDDCLQIYLADCRRVAQDANRRYCLLPTVPLYLYGKKHRGNFGEGYGDLTPIADGEDVPDGFELLLPEQLPRYSADQLAAFLDRELRNTAHFAFTD